MFNRPIAPQGNRIVSAYLRGQLLPCYHGSQLLSYPSLNATLLKLDKMLNFSKQESQFLWTPLLNNFADFVQIFPTYYGGPLQGLLVQGLQRSILGLEYLIHHETSQATSKLERYAVCSAMLLSNIRQVVIGHKCIVTESKGSFKENWDPYRGPICDRGDFYKIHPRAQFYASLIGHIDLILARQLMPEEGFSWIASDYEIFSDWLNTLTGQYSGGAGKIAHILRFIKENTSQLPVISLDSLDIEVLDSPDTAHADDFFNWIRQHLDSGKLSINAADSMIHTTEAGMFVQLERLGQMYLEQGKKGVSLALLLEQFQNLLGRVLDVAFEAQYGRMNSLISRKVKTISGVFLTSEDLLTGDSRIYSAYINALRRDVGPACHPYEKSALQTLGTSPSLKPKSK